MANPNIVAVTEIYGKLNVQTVTTSPSAIVSNNAGSGKIIKINSLIVSNVDGTNAATLNVDIFRSSTAIHVIKGVSIAAASSFTAIDKSITVYLEEGDSLRVTASANGDLEAIVSYEEII